MDFNAVSNKSDRIVVSPDNDFNDEGIIADVKLNNDLAEYSIDISDVLEER